MRKIKNKKENEIFKCFVETTKEVTISIKNETMKEMNKIIGLLQICFPCILIYFKIDIVEALAFSAGIYLFIWYMNKFLRNYFGTDKNGLPVPKTRLTKADGEYIEVNENIELEELIQYVFDIEEYIDRRGLR